MDPEPVSDAPRYWICTAGFWISGIALGLLSLSGALMIWVVLTLDRGLFLAMQQPWFTWGVELPITAGALIGSYLLWGRWTDASWQRRAGSLVVLNLCDTISWGIAQADQMGGLGIAVGQEWLIFNVVMVFGWIEFSLLANLSAEVASHLGIKAAPEAGRTAQQFSIVGLVLSSLYFVTQTRWGVGWPPIAGPPNFTEALMRLSVTFLRVIVSLQVATLCVIAGLACRRTARELVREQELAGAAHFESSGHQDSDLLQSPSDDDFPW